MLVQAGGGLPKEGVAPRPPNKDVLVDGNSNNLEDQPLYSDRDLEPRRNGILRVTFSAVEIQRRGWEEEEKMSTEQGGVEGGRTEQRIPQGQANISQSDGNFRSKLLRSEYEGWDNPFRAEGEISQDADLILKLWRQGRLKGDLRDLLARGGLRDQGGSPAQGAGCADSGFGHCAPPLQSAVINPSVNGTNTKCSDRNNGSGLLSESSVKINKTENSVKLRESEKSKKGKRNCCSIM